MKFNVKPGDIYEISTKKGLAYFQVTHVKHSFGSFIRVLPGIYSTRPNNLIEIANGASKFATFFPVGYAEKENEIQKVSHLDVPKQYQVLPLMRMGAMRNKSGELVSWSLLKGEDQVPAEMSAEEKLLPLASSPSLDVLKSMITGDHKIE